jgi:hypothetical protein
VDTLVAISIAAILFATMLPMSIYSGKVLLQVRMQHAVLISQTVGTSYEQMQASELHNL